MSRDDLLSQEEIDALLHGVSDGSISTENAEPTLDGEPRLIDLANQERIVRGRMPTLEMINERFARQLRITLSDLLRRPTETSVEEVNLMKYSEYIPSLYVPTSVNLVRMRPLRGTALFVFDPKLVFLLVDNFFGGDGRFHAKIEGRDFTAIETRVVRRVLTSAFKDLAEVWRAVLPVEFEYMNSEVNPKFANIVSPAEVVVISNFRIDLERGAGHLHVTLPYSMIEPIREILQTGIQADRSDADERWSRSMRREIEDAPVDINCPLTQTELRLDQVMKLRAGDVIPINMPDHVTLDVEDVPLWRGIYGTADGVNVIKLVERIRRDDETEQFRSVRHV